MTKMKKFLQLISRKRLEGFYSNLECGLPFMEANSTVNLVLFGEDIMELWIRENHNRVVPVNILIPFAHALFSWAPKHTTVCFDIFKLKPL